MRTTRSRRTASLVLIAGLLLVAAATAFAAKRTTGSGTFSDGPLVVTSQRQAGKNFIVKQQGPITVDGTISGSGVISERIVVHKNGTATFHGVWSCTCTVNGVSGPVVTRVRGKSTEDSFKGRFNTKGDDALQDFHGRGPFSGTPTSPNTDTGTYTLK